MDKHGSPDSYPSDLSMNPDRLDRASVPVKKGPGFHPVLSSTDLLRHAEHIFSSAGYPSECRTSPVSWPPGRIFCPGRESSCPGYPRHIRPAYSSRPVPAAGLRDCTVFLLCSAPFFCLRISPGSIRTRCGILPQAGFPFSPHSSCPSDTAADWDPCSTQSSLSCPGSGESGICS